MAFRSLLHHVPRSTAFWVTLVLGALVVGTLVTHRVTSQGVESRRYEVGIARTTAIIDTARSQLVDARAGAISPLAARAALVADLMTRSPMREAIADDAGIGRDELVVQRPMNGLERRLTIPEVSSTRVDADDRDAHVLRAGPVLLAEGDTPIVEIQVRAPTATRAARLADQAVRTLQTRLDSVTGLQPLPPATAQIDIQQLAPAVAATEMRGPRLWLGAAAGTFLLMVGCAIASVGRGLLVWRRAAARGAHGAAARTSGAA